MLQKMARPEQSAGRAIGPAAGRPLNVICLTQTRAEGEYGRLIPLHLVPAGSPPVGRRRGTLRNHVQARGSVHRKNPDPPDGRGGAFLTGDAPPRVLGVRKRMSRRNALRHGLTAETVIDGLETARTIGASRATAIFAIRRMTNWK
jgi:hypothetical protein